MTGNVASTVKDQLEELGQTRDLATDEKVGGMSRETLALEEIRQSLGALSRSIVKGDLAGSAMGPTQG